MPIARVEICDALVLALSLFAIVPRDNFHGTAGFASLERGWAFRHRHQQRCRPKHARWMPSALVGASCLEATLQPGGHIDKGSQPNVIHHWTWGGIIACTAVAVHKLCSRSQIEAANCSLSRKKCLRSKHLPYALSGFQSCRARERMLRLLYTALPKSSRYRLCMDRVNAAQGERMGYRLLARA